MQAEPLTGLVDIHHHILPGVDDGASNLETALEMARLAVADGIRKIVATPHPNKQTGIGSREITVQAVAKFNQALAENGIRELEIYPGVECYLVPEIVDRLKKGELFPLNHSRYVLIEFSTLVAPANIENMMFWLRDQNYVPIIAHPERYNYVQQDPIWLAKLVRLGCLSQVTAGSFYGRFGKRCQSSAEVLLRQNLVHLIASDAHNVKVRPPQISPARPAIEKLAGPKAFLKLAIEVPGIILTDQLFESAQPELLTGKPFWKFW